MWSKKGLQRGIPYEVKNPLVGVLTSYGVPSRGQNQKIPADSSSPCQKTPQNKKSAKLENFLKIRFFTPWSLFGVKFRFFKKLSNLADFLFWGVFWHGELESAGIF